jgi:hypothetical protein
MYCLWHVQRAWLKASKSVTNGTLRGAMWAELKLMLQIKARCSTRCGTLLQHPLNLCLRCAGFCVLVQIDTNKAAHGAQQWWAHGHRR